MAILQSWIVLALAAAFTHAAPTQPDCTPCGSNSVTPQCCPDCFGKLPSIYTLTAVKLNADGCGDGLYNGLKVQTWNLFEAKVASYCPFTGAQAVNCPNGTDMALVGTVEPDCEVPGGQDTYVQADGLIQITVQHSHSFPPGSYPYYYGWTWTPYEIYPGNPNMLANCDSSNAEYNCAYPTGYWQFKAPNATVGGLMACPNEFDATATSVYAVTPEFNRTDCVTLDGLGTHNYTGPNPPVWAYY